MPPRSPDVGWLTCLLAGNGGGLSWLGEEEMASWTKGSPGWGLRGDPPCAGRGLGAAVTTDANVPYNAVKLDETGGTADSWLFPEGMMIRTL